MSCQSCHEGPADGAFSGYEEAHVDMIADPSFTGACNELCHSAPEHQAIVTAAQNSMHTKIWGYKKAIDARCGCDYDVDSSEGFQLRCAGCHTGCGECHISRPNSADGGGFIDGHHFSASPDLTNQCTACHGSRVGTDYKGEIEGNQPDIHLLYGKKCEDCHDADELHGMATVTNPSGHWEHRYEVSDGSRCEECHGEGEDDEWDNEFHEAHVGEVDANLQCQVCHSQPYKNCSNCHPQPAGAEHGHIIDPSVVAFKIGKNLNPYRTEYDYCVVRHVPVAGDTFDDPMWEGLDLTEFDNVPTWKYSSPHNIRRTTDQANPDYVNGCGENCHAASPTNLGVYLRETDLYDEGSQLPDYQANLPVVIEDFH